MVDKGILIILPGFSAYRPVINCIIASMVIRFLTLERIFYLRRTNKVVRLIDALRVLAFLLLLHKTLG